MNCQNTEKKHSSSVDINTCNKANMIAESHDINNSNKKEEEKSI